MDWQPTTLGRIVAAGFKLPEPRMTVGLAGAGPRDFRFVPSVGTAGFLLSPAVQDTDDFLSLLEGGDGSGPTSVASVRFHCGVGSAFCGLWRQSIHLPLRGLRFDDRDTNPRYK